MCNLQAIKHSKKVTSSTIPKSQIVFFEEGYAKYARLKKSRKLLNAIKIAQGIVEKQDSQPDPSEHLSLQINQHQPESEQKKELPAQGESGMEELRQLMSKWEQASACQILDNLMLRRLQGTLALIQKKDEQKITQAEKEVYELAYEFQNNLFRRVLKFIEQREEVQKLVQEELERRIEREHQAKPPTQQKESFSELQIYKIHKKVIRKIGKLLKNKYLLSYDQACDWAVRLHQHIRSAHSQPSEEYQKAVSRLLLELREAQRREEVTGVQEWLQSELRGQ